MLVATSCTIQGVEPYKVLVVPTRWLLYWVINQLFNFNQVIKKTILLPSEKKNPENGKENVTKDKISTQNKTAQ